MGVEVPLVQTVEKVVEVPVVGETIQGRQHTVNVPIAPTRQVAEAETVTVTEMGPPLPAEQHPEAVMKQVPAPAPVLTTMSAPVPVAAAMPMQVTTMPFTAV